MGIDWILAIIVSIGLVVGYGVYAKKVRGAMGASIEKTGEVWRGLAMQLGFETEVVDYGQGPQGALGGGAILRGQHKGVPVEIRQLHRSTHKVNMMAARHEYTYEQDCSISAPTSGGPDWRVVPISDPVAAQPTGEARFDAILKYAGPPGALSQEQFQWLAHYGAWVTLEKAGGRLLLHDNFYEWYTAQYGRMATLSAVHPIWGTQGQMNAVTANTFLDFFVSMTGDAG